MPNETGDWYVDPVTGRWTRPAGVVDGPAPPVIEVASLRAFTHVVLDLHRVTAAAHDFLPMCSCRLPARCCDIVKAEHEVLGIPMPFTFGPLARPPYYEV